MSIAAIGSGPSQMLASLLSKLSSASSTTAAASSTAAATDSSSTAAVIPGSSNNTTTGSATAQLSAQVLGVLLMMQADSSGASGAASSGSTSSGSTDASPLSNLVSAIDTDGDGTISESELETYIESKGGTQAQADALYAGLNQNGSGNLTQAQMQSDLQNAGAAHHGHHHHHHNGGGMSANQVGSQLVQAMDSNSDGSVDQSEFESFVTALGGTTSQADADFSSLAGQTGSGITASQFGSAVSAFEQSAMGAASPVLNLLDDIAKTASGTASTATA